MPDDDRNDGPIRPPEPHRAADLGRAAAKGVLGAVPLAGSLLAEAADLTLPNPSEAERRRWEGDVTHGVNHLHGRVADLDQRVGEQIIRLTGGAAAAARYLIDHCPDGLAHDYVEASTIAEADPKVELDDVIDGLGELEAYGLVEPLDVIGGGDCYCLTEASYETLDSPLKGWDTMADARAIAAWAIGQGADVNVTALEAAMGWPRRRLNPALRVVLRQIDTENISREIQPAYVTGYFYLGNADRARLRRLAAEA